MASISTAFSLLQLQSPSPQFVICNAKSHRISANAIEFRTSVCFGSFWLKSGRLKSRWDLSVRAVGDSKNFNGRERVGGDGAETERWTVDSEKLLGRLRETVSAIPSVVFTKNRSKEWTVESEKILGRLRGTVSAIPSVVFTMKRYVGKSFAIGLFITIAFVVIAVREILARRTRYNQQGSVADLVKRGQLRSDRRGISRPLKYDDPFNNPFVKVGKGNSSVEMCGKVYRLAPVTLTRDQQSSHQKRRSRAYQWKRPTIFLKEGDPIPPDVDPDAIRWIPANHPFATTINDIDEELAQNNVYQTDGVPFRIKAEHEALQRKLEALQNEQKLNKVGIDPSNISDFQRHYKLLSKQQEQLEQSPTNHANTPKSDGSFENTSESEELRNP